MHATNFGRRGALHFLAASPPPSAGIRRRRRSPRLSASDRRARSAAGRRSRLETHRPAREQDRSNRSLPTFLGMVLARMQCQPGRDGSLSDPALAERERQRRLPGRPVGRLLNPASCVRPSFRCGNFKGAPSKTCLPKANSAAGAENRLSGIFRQSHRAVHELVTQELLRAARFGLRRLCNAHNRRARLTARFSTISPISSGIGSGTQLLARPHRAIQRKFFRRGDEQQTRVFSVERVCVTSRTICCQREGKDSPQLCPPK